MKNKLLTKFIKKTNDIMHKWILITPAALNQPSRLEELPNYVIRIISWVISLGKFLEAKLVSNSWRLTGRVFIYSWYVN